MSIETIQAGLMRVSFSIANPMYWISTLKMSWQFRLPFLINHLALLSLSGASDVHEI